LRIVTQRIVDHENRRLAVGSGSKRSPQRLRIGR
jgi:hypothetical protein